MLQSVKTTGLTTKFISPKQQLRIAFIYVKQLNGGIGYYEAETETKSGIVGSTFTVTPKTYPGFAYVPSTTSGIITADDLASVTLYYDQNPLNYAMNFSTKGSYIAPIIAPKDAAITAPAASTRQGYTFAGWDIDGDGTADALPNTMPDHNIEVEALWTPATVSYRIDYYKQNTDMTTYSFVESEQGTALAESQAPQAPARDTGEGKKFAYFQYSHEDHLTVAGDGTSVLNVYYDRVPITVNLYVQLADGTKALYKTVTTPFGVNVAQPNQSEATAFYKSHGGANANMNPWVNNKNANTSDPLEISERTVDFASKTSGYTASFTDLTLYTYYQLMRYEQLDGTYTEQAEKYVIAWTNTTVSVSDNTPGFTPTRGRSTTGMYDGGDSSAAAWGNWYPLTTPGEELDFQLLGGVYNTVQFEFTRNSYNTLYYSGGSQVGQATHKYEQTYDPHMTTALSRL